jgi:hypothetical protein
MTRRRLISMLDSLPAEAMLSILPRFGYQRSEEIPGRGFIYTSAETGDQLAVPTNKRFNDYGSACLGLLESLVSPAVTLDDLTSMLVLPECDIYRHKFEDDLAKWGSFPLLAFTEAVPALLDFLRYTAAGVHSHRESYTKLPEPADRFGQGCRVGQTEQSSYVVKIFCPTNPTGETFVNDVDEPFGRIVTRACIENLAFLREENAGAIESDLPATLNKNVAGAIARLRPLSFHPDAAASIWFSGRYGSKPEVSTIKIDQDTFERAISIERRLTGDTGIERAVYVGYIVDLHKDRPQKKISQKVTLDVREGGGWRKLSVTLLPSQYRDAIRWHDRGQRIRIDAMFDQRTKPWRALEIFEFANLDAAQFDLFEESSPKPPSDMGPDVN